MRSLPDARATAAPAPQSEIEPERLFDELRRRLPRDLPLRALDPSIVPPYGDQSLNDWDVSADFLATTRPAAVLVGLVARENGVHVLLTLRTADLRDHAGQIAFPGGKIEASDASPADAALREAYEEVGLPSSAVEVIGYLDPYLTRTRYRILPVVARLHPPFTLTINPAEVVEAFEVPFAFLMDAANYETRQREWLGKPRSFFAVTHGERLIWGITAGILRVLSERLQS
jgi:8-oxo-dGTP pyrophosphatase MutT (NUDIX family)